MASTTVTRIYVKVFPVPPNTRLSLDLVLHSTDVPQLIATIRQQLGAIGKIPPGKVANVVRLLFSGRVLNPTQRSTLAELHLHKECTVQAMLRFVDDIDHSVLSVKCNLPSVTPLLQRTDSPKTLPDHSRTEVSPHGDVLIVELQSAKKLVRADFFTRSSDPYVVLALGEDSAHSTVVKRRRSPVWNQTFAFFLTREAVSSGAVPSLSVMVFDHNFMRSDEFLGQLEFDVNAMSPGNPVRHINGFVLQDIRKGVLFLVLKRYRLPSERMASLCREACREGTPLTDGWFHTQRVSLQQLCGLEDFGGDSSGAAVVSRTLQSVPLVKSLVDRLCSRREVVRSHSKARYVAALLYDHGLVFTRDLPSTALLVCGLPPSCEEDVEGLVRTLQEVSQGALLALHPKKGGGVVAEFKDKSLATVALAQLQGTVIVNSVTPVHVCFSQPRGLCRDGVAPGACMVGCGVFGVSVRKTSKSVPALASIGRSSRVLLADWKNTVDEQEKLKTMEAKHWHESLVAVYTDGTVLIFENVRNEPEHTFRVSDFGVELKSNVFLEFQQKRRSRHFVTFSLRAPTFSGVGEDGEWDMHRWHSLFKTVAHNARSVSLSPSSSSPRPSPRSSSQSRSMSTSVSLSVSESASFSMSVSTTFVESAKDNSTGTEDDKDGADEKHNTDSDTETEEEPDEEEEDVHLATAPEQGPDDCSWYFDCTECHQSRPLWQWTPGNGSEADGRRLQGLECRACVRDWILHCVAERHLVSVKCRFSHKDILDILSPAEVKRYSEAAFEDLMAEKRRAGQYATCPSCSTAMVVDDHTAATEAISCAVHTGISGKPLSLDAKRHFLDERILCRKCDSDFCKSCSETPYHTGFGCAAFVEWRDSPKCRFCNEAVLERLRVGAPDSEALHDVCFSVACQVKASQSCIKRLSCGHVCLGVRDEEQCLPCMASGCEHYGTPPREGKEEEHRQEEERILDDLLQEMEVQENVVDQAVTMVLFLECIPQEVKEAHADAASWSLPLLAEYLVGTRLDYKDVGMGRWYLADVLARRMEEEELRVLLHFVGWSTSNDVWVPLRMEHMCTCAIHETECSDREHRVAVPGRWTCHAEEEEEKKEEQKEDVAQDATPQEPTRPPVSFWVPFGALDLRRSASLSIVEQPDEQREDTDEREQLAACLLGFARSFPDDDWPASLEQVAELLVHSGSHVDVKDVGMRSWEDAVVVEAGQHEGRTRVRVHFVGRSEEWDAWVPFGVGTICCCPSSGVCSGVGHRVAPSATWVEGVGDGDDTTDDDADDEQESAARSDLRGVQGVPSPSPVHWDSSSSEGFESGYDTSSESGSDSIPAPPHRLPPPPPLPQRPAASNLDGPTVPCPVCSSLVPEGAVNEHLDECLSASLIQDMRQDAPVPLAPPPVPSAPVPPHRRTLRRSRPPRMRFQTKECTQCRVVRPRLRFYDHEWSSVYPRCRDCVPNVRTDTLDRRIERISGRECSRCHVVKPASLFNRLQLIARNPLCSPCIRTQNRRRLRSAPASSRGAMLEQIQNRRGRNVAPPRLRPMFRRVQSRLGGRSVNPVARQAMFDHTNPAYIRFPLEIRIRSGGAGPGGQGNMEDFFAEMNGERLPHSLEKGLHVVAVVAVEDSPSNFRIQHQRFDMHDNDRVESANDFGRFVRSLPNGTPCCCVVMGDCQRTLNLAAIRAAMSLGSDMIHNLRLNGSWALIGRKGAPMGSVPEAVNNPSDESFSTPVLTFSLDRPSLSQSGLTSVLSIESLPERKWPAVAPFRQTASDVCNICFVDELQCAPCILLRCGHVFHKHCVQTRLEKRWGGARVNFRFATCALCSVSMQHWSVVEWTDPVEQMAHGVVCDLGSDRIAQCVDDEKEEKEEKTDEEQLPSHVPSHNTVAVRYAPSYWHDLKLLELALRVYSYFMCCKCQQPFFVGKNDCAAGMDEELDEDGNAPQQTCMDCLAKVPENALEEIPGGKHCPFCNSPITHFKNDGCHHIGYGMGGCPGRNADGSRCGRHWCYHCLHEWPGPTCTSKHWYCSSGEACACPECPDCKKLSGSRRCAIHS